MAEQQTTPKRVRDVSVSGFRYDVIAGPLRCTALLARGLPRVDIRAIWRNETGQAAVTLPRART